MLSDGQPWCLRLVPGAQVTLVLQHAGDWQVPEFSIQGQKLTPLPNLQLQEHTQISQSVALKFLKLLEPAYANGIAYPETSMLERQTATLQVSLQGQVF